MTERMYFLGVSTAESSVHRIFPRWAALAGFPGAVLVGRDLPIEAPAGAYRAVVEEMLADPDSRGGLVTTHKVAIYEHARDLFAEFDADAAGLGEVSGLVQRNRRLAGIAIDTVTSGLALRTIVPTWPFRGHVLVLGAGGAGLALSVHLFREHRPEQVILSDVSEARLEHATQFTAARCVQVAGPEDNDRLVVSLPPGSLIVNATGLGKDRAGSPVSAEVRFPEGAIAWDFNYRGELLFLAYARSQGARAVDGWEYFLHGWSQILARVLGFELTPELFAAMRQAAGER